MTRSIEELEQAEKDIQEEKRKAAQEARMIEAQQRKDRLYLTMENYAKKLVSELITQGFPDAHYTREGNIPKIYISEAYSKIRDVSINIEEPEYNWSEPTIRVGYRYWGGQVYHVRKDGTFNYPKIVEKAVSTYNEKVYNEELQKKQFKVLHENDKISSEIWDFVPSELRGYITVVSSNSLVDSFKLTLNQLYVNKEKAIKIVSAIAKAMKE